MKRSGASLFLIELVIMLTVFVIAAAVDTLMLVKANNISRESRDLDRAVEYAVSAADSYRATGSGETAGMTGQGDGWAMYFDAGWQAAPAEKGVYSVTLTPAEGGAQVAVKNGQESIYSLYVKAADYEQ